MAYVDFDCGDSVFEIVSDNPKIKETILIQTDWDYPGIASAMGWKACDCGRTDGTVDCKSCNRKASDMISEALDFIESHEGESFETLEDYFTYLE